MKPRKYSHEFKKQIVADFESGQFSVKQLKKLHGVADQVNYRWIHKFSTFNQKCFRVVDMNESSKNKLNELSMALTEQDNAFSERINRTIK